MRLTPKLALCREPRNWWAGTTSMSGARCCNMHVEAEVDGFTSSIRRPSRYPEKPGRMSGAGWSNTKRSYWIPGSYVPTWSENRHSFLRPLKKKGLKEGRVTKVGLDDIGKATTLESNKSLRQKDTPDVSRKGRHCYPHVAYLQRRHGGHAPRIRRGRRGWVNRCPPPEYCPLPGECRDRAACPREGGAPEAPTYAGVNESESSCSARA